LKKVCAEALCACLAYNLAQWVRLRWRVQLAAAPAYGTKPSKAKRLRQNEEVRPCLLL